MWVCAHMSCVSECVFVGICILRIYSYVYAWCVYICMLCGCVVHICVYVCVHRYTWTCVFVCPHLWVYAYVSVCMCIDSPSITRREVHSVAPRPGGNLISLGSQGPTCWAMGKAEPSQTWKTDEFIFRFCCELVVPGMANGSERQHLHLAESEWLRGDLGELFGNIYHFPIMLEKLPLLRREISSGSGGWRKCRFLLA